MADCMVEFMSPGFPHNFVKKNRQELKMGYIDASRRHIQSAPKIVSKIIRRRNYGTLSFDDPF